MLDFSKTYLYRMTHIENISHILQFGITHKTSNNSNKNFKSIGDNSLINTRNNFKLKNGKLLGEYIPFYFGYRTPMLFVIQKGYNLVEPTPAENIIYCVSSIQRILELQLDFVFTDGHAVNDFSLQFDKSDLQNLDKILDINAIKATFWKDETDLDLKRRKEAEFLVLGDISIDALLGYIVYNENAKNTLIKFGVEKEKVLIRSERYY